MEITLQTSAGEVVEPQPSTQPHPKKQKVIIVGVGGALAKVLAAGLDGVGERIAVPLPVPVVIYCPACQTKHIDEGEWATRPHKTHKCQNCSLEWRPFPYATVGIVGAPASGDAAPLRDELKKAKEEITASLWAFMNNSTRPKIVAEDAAERAAKKFFDDYKSCGLHHHMSLDLDQAVGKLAAIIRETK